MRNNLILASLFTLVLWQFQHCQQLLNGLDFASISSDVPLRPGASTTTRKRSSGTPQGESQGSSDPRLPGGAESYFSLPSGRNWKDGTVVCVVDVDAGHLAMFMNVAISLDPLCGHLLALAYDIDVIQDLKKYNVPFVYSKPLRDSVLRRIADKNVSAYLEYPMAAKLQLLHELLVQGIPVWFSDADTFHMRSFGNILRESRRKSSLPNSTETPIDIVVSAFRQRARFAKGIWAEWVGPFIPGSSTITLNNGVAAYWPSKQTLHLLSDVKSGPRGGGWGQVNFNAALRRGTSITASKIFGKNQYLGYNNYYNISFLVVTAVHSVWEQDCVGSARRAKDDTGCFHHHALNTGGNSVGTGTNRAMQVGHSNARTAAMNASGYWVLRDDWKEVQPKYDFSEFLLAVDKRRH